MTRQPDMQALLSEIRAAIEASSGWTSARQNHNAVSFDAVETISQGWRLLLCVDVTTDGWPSIGTATNADKGTIVNLPPELIELALEKSRMSKPVLPVDVDDVTYAFPAQVIGTLLPKAEEIPKEIRDHWGRWKWSSLAEDWFYDGLPDDVVFYPKEGVDSKKAVRQLSACLRSYQPSQQHKIAGVAYLMDCFFEKVEVPSKGKAYPKGIA